MIWDIIFLILSIFLLGGGLLGCIIPVIPGPPLSFIALLVLQVTQFADFSFRFLLVAAIVTALVTVVDYILPVWGTRKFGGTRAGTIGAVLGLLVGLFFAPVGIFAGPFLGAFAGELISGRNADTAFRSGFGSFIGFLFGTVMKLTVCLAFTFYYIRELVFQ